jgi:hypothetical protein
VDLLHTSQIKIIECLEMVLTNIVQYLVLVLFVKCELNVRHLLQKNVKSMRLTFCLSPSVVYVVKSYVKLL